MNETPAAHFVLTFFKPYLMTLEYCYFLPDCYEEMSFRIEVKGVKYCFRGFSKEEITQKLDKSELNEEIEDLDQIWEHVAYPTYAADIDMNADWLLKCAPKEQ